MYKTIQNLVGSPKTEVTAGWLCLFFLAQLLIVSCCFFAFNGGSIISGFVLFSKILFLFVPVSLLWLVFYSAWDTTLRYTKYLGITDKNIQVLASIGLGFIIFMMLVFLSISLWVYNLTAVILIFIGTLIYSYKSLMWVFRSVKTPLKTYSHDLSAKASFSERYNSWLIIDEIHYIIITFLISVNMVSIYRPFPIGWDDLGAYMNHPKLLAGAGEHLALWKMYFWELYTGIGFLFGSQTLAFYLNSFSWIIVVITLYLAISTFIKDKKTSFDFSLFSWMILLSMPMVVFQLAKDMKLDLWLLCMSIIALGLCYYLVFSEKSKNIWAYMLLWIFIWVAFSIKVTSLLLLLWVIGAICYSYYSLWGFLAFVAVFVGIFSYLNLWPMMNVVVPESSEGLKVFWMYLLGIWAWVFAGSHFYQKKTWKDIASLFTKIGLISLWFFVILLPWGIKNISELPEKKSLAIGNIISGSHSFYKPDYSQILSEKKIQEIQNRKKWLTQTGTTDNEDLGRYFWYETGINNYLKLPWNLTFQLNQKGEFTDISYIFFALLPALFLFLPYRKNIYLYGFLWAMVLSLLYFIPSDISLSISQIFSWIHLPLWYIVIAALFLFPLVYLHFGLKKEDKIIKLFLINLAFTTIYLWLWAVSAFGIVWYGILMYFALLFMISLCLYYMDSSEQGNARYGVYAVLIIVWVYMLQSAIPHGLTNLKKAWYWDFKRGLMTEEVGLMSFHPEYFPLLFEMNIADHYKEEMFIEYRNKLLSIIDDTQYASVLVPNIQASTSMWVLHEIMRKVASFDLENSVANNELMSLRQSLYDEVIYVSEHKNTQKIHRVGTFLKYYISENNTRIFEDSLLSNFDDYIYSQDADETLSRLKDLDVWYILLDINAPTIDQDPGKSLTKRYERMLEFITHDNLSLVWTDSMCLRIARDTHKIDGDTQKYMDTAGVNYSHEKSSAEKKNLCVDTIIEIISNPEILEKYPYLNGYLASLERAKVSLNDTHAIKQGLLRFVPNGYKVLLKVE